VLPFCLFVTRAGFDTAADFLEKLGFEDLAQKSRETAKDLRSQALKLMHEKAIVSQRLFFKTFKSTAPRG
jgi:GH15 family glucan-1,4-alpha-glucosidase